MKIDERRILFWHLFDLKGKDIFTMADDLGYKPGYIDNVRTGRKALANTFRYKVAKTYPHLTNFIIHGEPPELPECKTHIVRAWHASGDDLEAIAVRTGYAIGYLRRMFSGGCPVSDEFKQAMIASYPLQEGK